MSKHFISKHSDRSRMRDILNLHLVRDRLNTERIRQGNMNSVNIEFIFIDFFFSQHIFGSMI